MYECNASVTRKAVKKYRRPDNNYRSVIMKKDLRNS